MADRIADAFAVRPYAITGGRTRPRTPLDLTSMVRATGHGQVPTDNLSHVHSDTLRLCGTPVSVAEIAARLGRSVTVTKVLLSDLISLGLIITRLPTPAHYATDRRTLEAVIDGLRAL
jgi:hypothetical protein